MYFLKFIILLFTLFQSLNPALTFASKTSSIVLKNTASKLNLKYPLLNVSGVLDIGNSSLDTAIIQETANDYIQLNGGRIKEGTLNNKKKITGKVLTGAFKKICLDGSAELNVQEDIDVPVEIVSTGNKIIGSPNFLQEITLADANAELEIGINNTLSKNINLNGGTLKLTKDLALQDNIHINGNGTINVNDLSFMLPVKDDSPWTGEIDFINANDVTLRRYTKLTGKWSFSSSTNELHGWGHVLDISGGGTLYIDNNDDLHIANTHIKGLGDGKGKLEFGNGNSKVFLSFCTLELDGSWTYDEGEIIVHGDNCKIICRNKEKIIVNNNAKFTIDGVALLYENMTMAAAGAVPITTTNGGIFSKINSGVVRSAVANATQESTNFDSDDTENQSASNIDLTSGSNMLFSNSNTSVAKSVNFDGQGNSINFGETTTQPLAISDNVTLNVSSTVLNNFDPAKIDFQGSGGTQGKMVIGDNVTIKTSKNINFNTSQISFAGNATIEGTGSNIVEVDSQKMLLSGGKKLTLKGMVVKANAIDSLRCQDDNSTFEFQKTDLVLTSSGLSFNTGSLEINGDVKILGLDETGSTSASEFRFTSKKKLTIKPGGTLTIDRLTKFDYNPNTTEDANSSEQKRHLVFQDPSSALISNGATIKTGPGLALDHGNFIINGKTKFEIENTAGKELELGSALQINIGSGASLEVNGPVKYVPTTYSP